MKVSIFNLDASHISNGVLPILVLDPENADDEVVIDELRRRKLCSNTKKLFEDIGIRPFLVKKIIIPLDERY